MRPIARQILLAAAITLAGAVPAAHATVMSGTFTAVMIGGSIDTANYFGGGDLGGKTITGTFSYDSAALASNNCSVAGEGCFFGQVGITTTIGGNTVSFPSAPGGDSLYGIVQYGGFPASSTQTDEFNISSFYGTFPNMGVITVELWSKTSDFIPNPLDTTTTFSLAAADINSNSIGNIELPLGGGLFENLQFQFSSPGSSESRAPGGGEGGSGIPEPASVLLLAVGLAGAAVARRRSRRVSLDQ